jgi:hypothetical protein
MEEGGVLAVQEGHPPGCLEGDLFLLPPSQLFERAPQDIKDTPLLAELHHPRQRILTGTVLN